MSKTFKKEEHWNNVFTNRDYTQVFWHQERPLHSLNLICKYAKKEDKILDVGAGASYLVEALIENGYENITLLDISSVSQQIVKKRLGNHANIPHYIQSDVLNFKSTQEYDLWHDRALFHFLLEEHEQRCYLDVLENTLVKNGLALINVFGKGENSCAGLTTASYDEASMLRLLPQGLKLVSFEEFIHITPKGGEQKYVGFILRKR